MRQSSVCLLALLAVVLAGCATLPPEDLAAIRQRGVPAPVIAKIQRGKPLTPPEIIGLSRRGVPDYTIKRCIRAGGVDYLVTKYDVIRMRRDRVSAEVIDTLLEECDDFARKYDEPVYDSYDYWWADSLYFSPGLYVSPW
jgi:hypothetical protein